jgi:hypothetical protein
MNVPQSSEKKRKKKKQEEEKSAAGAAGAEIVRVPIHHRCKHKQRATNNTKNNCSSSIH